MTTGTGSFPSSANSHVMFVEGFTGLSLSNLRKEFGKADEKKKDLKVIAITQFVINILKVQISGQIKNIWSTGKTSSLLCPQW